MKITVVLEYPDDAKPKWLELHGGDAVKVKEGDALQELDERLEDGERTK